MITARNNVKPTARIHLYNGIPSIDRRTLMAMLDIHGGPKAVAKALNVSRTTVHKCMKFYQIKSVKKVVKYE